MTAMAVADRRSLGLLFAVLVAACGSTLPDDVLGYESRCIRLNREPIPRYDGDPHKGMKNVFACNVGQAQLQENTRPFADGALVVKESTREGDSFPWLIATARKQAGSWRWDEYTRNFADEDFRHILAGQSVCTGCHVKVQTADWIFTTYDRRP
jgi:hypothetical protein